MNLQLAYWLLLGALVPCTMLRGSNQMIRTILTILGVGFMSLSFATTDFFAWPSVNYALAMMAVNAAGAIVVLLHPAGKVQSLIGVTFLLQCTIHFGRILNGDNADITMYWWGLSVPAMLQLVLAGGWWVEHEYHCWRNSLHQHRPLSRPAHPKGMEG